MKIDSGVLERLHEIIEDSSLSRRQFALGIGHAPSTITEIFSKRIKTLSGSVITILELKYGINPEWLATGRGSKYRETLMVTDESDFNLLKKFRRLKKSNKTMLLHFADTLYAQQHDHDTGEDVAMQVADAPDESYHDNSTS